jgi:hypothetical protein
MGGMYRILEEMKNFHSILMKQGLMIDTFLQIRTGNSMQGEG